MKNNKSRRLQKGLTLVAILLVLVEIPLIAFIARNMSIPVKEDCTIATPMPILESTLEPTSELIVTEQPEEIQIMRYFLSEEEINLFARLVYAEAGTSSYDCQVAVAATVLNRMDSNLYPDSIEEVIFQADQFEPAQDGEIYTGRGSNKELVTQEMMQAENSRALEAVYAALEGEDPTKELLMAMGEEGGALYFFQPEALSEEEMNARYGIQNCLKIGTEVFYRSW